MAGRNYITPLPPKRTAVDSLGIDVEEGEPTKEIITGDEVAVPIYKDGIWLGEVTFRKKDWDHIVPEPDDPDNNREADKLRKLLDGIFDRKVYRLGNMEELLTELFELGYTRRE